MWLVRLQQILFGLMLMLLGAVGFAAGVWTAKSSVRPARSLSLPSVPHEEAQRARKLLEEALTARFDGDNRKALQLLDDAGRADPSLLGLEYQRGLTFLFDGDFSAAEESAKTSLSRKEALADSYALLVMIAAGRAAAGQASDPAQVAEWAEKARQADPLAPFIHYARGEYARAIGQPAEAVGHFHKALERVSPADSYQMATIKTGLSDLRTSPSDGPKIAVLPSGESLPPPEQLVFAAGQALLDGDRTGADALLKRARDAMKPETFSAVSQDSFFQDFLTGDSILPP